MRAVMMTDGDTELAAAAAVAAAASTGEGMEGEYMDDRMLSVGETDAEFDLEVEKLNEMRLREAAIRAEQREEERKEEQRRQQLALQQRGREAQLASQRLQQHQKAAAGGELSDDERTQQPGLLSRELSAMSTISTSSSASNLTDPNAGWVTVVDVKITPHRPASPSASSSSLSSFDAPLVDVRFHIFQRYVPHLASGSRTIESVSRRQQEYIQQMEQEEGYSSDTSSEGEESMEEAEETGAEPLHLTGNREIDAATLRRLIGMAEDDSDDSDDERPQAVGSSGGGHQVLSSTRTSVHDEDGEDEEAASSSPLRTAHELPRDALPPVVPFTVSASDSLQWCGCVTAVVDGMLVVQCQLGGRALDIGSAVCAEDRSAIGRVEEVFGPVSEPLYSIRPLAAFDISKQAPACGTRVYSVSSQSSFVLADSTPGCDASNPFDEEVEAAQAEFSDDEKEQAAKHDWKQRSKQQQQQQQQQQRHSGLQPPAAAAQQHHSGGSGGAASPRVRSQQRLQHRPGSSQPPSRIRPSLSPPSPSEAAAAAPSHRQQPPHWPHYAAAAAYPTPPAAYPYPYPYPPHPMYAYQPQQPHAYPLPVQQQQQLPHAPLAHYYTPYPSAP